MISLCLPAQNITRLVDVKRVSESFRTLPICSPRTDMMSVKAQADKQDNRYVVRPSGTCREDAENGKHNQ